MIKGILFDFDGTISDRVSSAYAMYRYIVHSILPDIDENSVEFEAIIQRCMLWDEFGTIKKSHVLRHLKENYAPNLDLDYWNQAWYDKFYMFQSTQENAIEVIRRLKEKYKLGIITNGDGKSQDAKLKFLDLYPYFDTVLISGVFGVHKPDPSIYYKAAENLGLKCEEIAFIGDTFATDIFGAIKAGMLPIWYCNEHRGVSKYSVTQMTNYRQIEQYFLHDIYEKD